jgi:hypothetical protein
MEDGNPALDKELAAARESGVDLNKVARIPGSSSDDDPSLRFQNRHRVIRLN